MALLTTTLPPRRNGTARFDGVDYVFVGGKVAVPDEAIAARMVATGHYGWAEAQPLQAVVPDAAVTEVPEEAAEPETVKPKAKAKK